MSPQIGFHTPDEPGDVGMDGVQEQFRDEGGWQPIETAPNDIIDVIAKHYDAALDIFISTRWANCVLVDGDVLWSPPYAVEPMKLTAHGYRPTHWMCIPKPPADLLKAES